MAKYQDLSISDASFTAAVDLTLVQYYFVRAGSVAGEVAIANGASNPTPLGVLQNAPSPGQEARVRVLGFSKVFAVTGGTCGIGYGRFITVNASGQAIPTATEAGSAVMGRWLDTGAPVSASRFGQAFINCAGFAPCAVSAC